MEGEIECFNSLATRLVDRGYAGYSGGRVRRGRFPEALEHLDEMEDSINYIEMMIFT